MKRLLALALIGSLFIVTSQAAVLITFEVKAVQTGLTGSSSPDAIISSDGSNVSLYDGQVVLQLIAFIHTLNAIDDDSFISTAGSWVTVGTTGDVTGFLRGDSLTTSGINNVALFRGNGSRPGAQAELSGTVPGNTNDSIGDIGGTSSSGFTGYFSANALLPFVARGQSFLIGETILDVTGGSGSTTVRYVPRIGIFPPITGNRSNIRFYRDNADYRINGDGTAAGPSAPPVDPDAVEYRSVTIQAGVSVPEPSIFGMFAPGVLALASLRRRKVWGAPISAELGRRSSRR